MKSAKHLAASLLALGVFGATSAVHADPIDLLDAFTINMSKYGFSWTSSSFTVAVDNLGADKQITLVQEQADGSWQEFPMYYKGTGGSDRELWTIGHDLTNTGAFALKYSVNGTTYWDNNNGQNYQFDAQGHLLGADQTIYVPSYSVSETANSQTGLHTFNATIVLKNLGHNKTVRLVYSSDNWATSTVVDASYAGSPVFYGYGSYLNPNANGTEVWTVSTPVAADFDGEFFIEYQVNGQSYYDNNFNADYPIAFDANYDDVYFKQTPTWSGYPMQLIDDHLWSTGLTVASDTVSEFKFDIFNDWTVNFGDDNQDGIADPNGANIQEGTAGTYRVFFNDETKQYWLQRYQD